MALFFVIVIFLTIPCLSYVATKFRPMIVLYLFMLLIGVSYFGLMLRFLLMVEAYYDLPFSGTLGTIDFLSGLVGMGLGFGFCLHKITNSRSP